VLLALLVGGAAITLTLGPPSPSTWTAAAVLVMGPLYVGLPLGAIAWIQWTLGSAVTTWLLVTIAVSDSAQYYTGRAFGRAKLAPSVSPAKTREGAVGGVLAAAVVGAGLGLVWLPGAAVLTAGATAAALALVGIVGDLFESMLKRGVGVKDSSQLIPGHGGVLDRIDSHLLAAPAFYVIVRSLW
jgi:phosphatidate cytidylyltransferase